MFGGTILAAIETAQVSYGNQMGTDATGAELVSTMNINLSNDWMGPARVAQSPDPGQLHPIGLGDLQNGYWYQDSSGAWIQRQGPLIGSDNMPVFSRAPYSTQEIQAAIQGIATAEQGATGDQLTALEAARQTWSSLSSQMSNEKDLETSPLTTLAQGESSAIQQDQSAVSGSSSLGSGLASLDGIVANLVTSIS